LLRSFAILRVLNFSNLGKLVLILLLLVTWFSCFMCLYITFCILLGFHVSCHGQGFICNFPTLFLVILCLNTHSVWSFVNSVRKHFAIVVSPTVSKFVSYG
jgi:hypothetical protein